MAAGQGFKTFITGEVLTAGDVNGYLMQGINVFASEAARNAAITSPQEGQFAFTKDTNSTWYYDGAAWIASGASGDVTGVTAGTGITVTDPSGPVPTVTNSMATAIDAKGDLVAGTGADAFSRLAVGANNTVLTADSATATGLKWAAASGGKIGQVLFTGISATTALTSTTYVTHGSLSITPASASSKILVFMIGQVRTRTAIGTSNVECKVHIFRGTTDLSANVAGRVGTYGYNTAVGDAQVDFTVPCMFLDSPATTSSVTYNLNGNLVSGNTSYLTDGSSILLIEVLP
jgi:hypothetical protein